MGVSGKLWRLGVRFCRAPIKTARTVPDLIESVRMRARGDSIFRRKQDLVHASNCPSRMIDKAFELWHPSSLLDVGCGTGKVLDFVISKGISDVVGIEGSQLAIDEAAQPQLIRHKDLSQPVDLGRHFDLVYSVEVAEHIPPSAADEFVRTLARHGDRILMTAAHPGQGGLGHLNEQEPAYWEALMAKVGFVPDAQSRDTLREVGDLYHENLMVFVRTT